MAGDDVGFEQFSDEDRGYSGSRFRDVVDALFANPYQKVWGRAGEPPLPEQDVTIKSVFGGLLSLARPPAEVINWTSLPSGMTKQWIVENSGGTIDAGYFDQSLGAAGYVSSKAATIPAANNVGILVALKPAA